MKPALPHHTLVLLLLACLSTALPSVNSQAQTAAHSLNQAFAAAAQEFGVPRDVLVAIAYAETRFDDHNGEPSIDNGYGLMHLVDNPTTQTLSRAARLLQLPPATLISDMTANIRGGAALLDAYADEQGLQGAQRQALGAWYPIVARYSNASDPALARLYADDVYRLLNEGLRGVSNQGEVISVSGQPVTPQRGPYEQAGSIQIQSDDYAPALWKAAARSNYSDGRQNTPITHIIIHTTEGSYTSAIAWFQDPASKVSAHYVIRSADGQITQMVREQDTAYHAGYWDWNLRSIGIEHEAYASDPSWFTDAMYRASAALVRNIAAKYNIPLDRQHILGHSEIKSTKGDPGPHWDWDYYMSLLRSGSTPVIIPDNGDTIIDNLETTFWRSDVNWYGRACGYNNHTFYTYATNNPAQSTNHGVWRPRLPRDGTYRVRVHIPQGCAIRTAPYATTNARYQIVYDGGSAEKVVDHNAGPGADEYWVELGTYRFRAGDSGYVRLTDLTNEPYSGDPQRDRVIFFDAVSFEYVEEPPRWGARLLSAQPISNVVPTGGLLMIAFTIQNTGNQPLNTQDPAGASIAGVLDGTVYDASQCFWAFGGRSQGMLRATLGFAPGSASVPIGCADQYGDYPWRWGLRTTLQPGETRTIIGYVRFNTPGTYTLQANLVSELIGYYGADGGGTPLRVGPITVKPFPYRAWLPQVQP